MKTVPVKTRLLLISSSLVFLLSFNSVAEDEPDIPNLEFLEFLGSFETPDGKWIDPMEIENMLDKTDTLNTNTSDNHIIENNVESSIKKKEVGSDE